MVRVDVVRQGPQRCDVVVCLENGTLIKRCIHMGPNAMQNAIQTVRDEEELLDLYRFKSDGPPQHP